MGVSVKGRRKIIVDSRIYVWHIKEDYDSPYYILHVVSNDKSLIISCPLGTKTSYVILKGGASWRRYRVPFEIPQAITPKFVAALIRWAAQDSGANDGAEEIKWNGDDIPV